MKKQSIKLFAAVALFVASGFTVNAQALKLPAPSPTVTVEQNFALSTIKLEYSRPSAKDRAIYGGLVPYGKTWRTGANSATKITFGEDVMVEGKALTAGTYALYTVPNKDSWDIMFYKDLTLGGSVNDYKMENEVLRVMVKPTALANKVETFTMNVADMKPSSASVELLWENTRVAFAITVDNDAKIMKSIETSLAADSRPYFQAASYYLDNGKDLNKALEWINIAADQNPKAFWIKHAKAKIQLKMNDKAGAIKTAEESMALAKEAKNDDYVTLNEKLIADAKK